MKRRKRKSKILASLLFVILLGTLVFIISVNTMYIMTKVEERDSLKKELLTLKDKEEVLKKDIVKMQDPDYVAKYAREKYFYSKPNEIILRMD